MGNNPDRTLTRAYTTEPKVYIEIIPHNNQAGRLSNKDKLIKHSQVLPLNIQGGEGKTISGS